MQHFDGTLEGVYSASKIVHALRPDLYDLQEAYALIIGFLNSLTGKGDGAVIGTGGFEMQKWVDPDDGGVEYTLNYHIMSIHHYSDDDSGSTVWCEELVDALPKHLEYVSELSDEEGMVSAKRYVDSLA